MQSKVRVHNALKRQAVDRVPVFMWFHPQTAAILADYLRIPAQYVGDVMGNDIKQVWVNNNYAMEGITHDRDGEGHTDFWGIRWVKEGPFNQIAEYPLAKAGTDEILRYEFPCEHIDELLRQMDKIVSFGDEYFIGCDVSPCLFEMYWRLRGLENGLCDLVGQPDIADVLLGRCADFACALSQAACARYKLDWLWTGDDVGGQEGMLIRPELWREMMKPKLKKVVDVGKKHGLWVAYHSCGGIRPIIPDLIEIGIDVLNPLQGNCPGMDPIELKAEFGDKLAFMGGVDTQGVLPNGSVHDVIKATERLISKMTQNGGGYILAASHTVPPETPLDNIFAMYEVAGMSRKEIISKAEQFRMI